MGDLMYYDGSQVFMASTQTKQLLCVVFKENDSGEPVSLCAAVTFDWLADYISGKNDLRDTLVKTPVKRFFLMRGVHHSLEDDKLEEIDSPSDYMLPDPGLYNGTPLSQ